MLRSVTYSPSPKAPPNLHQSEERLIAGTEMCFPDLHPILALRGLFFSPGKCVPLDWEGAPGGGPYFVLWTDMLQFTGISNICGGSFALDAMWEEHEQNIWRQNACEEMSWIYGFLLWVSGYTFQLLFWSLRPLSDGIITISVFPSKVNVQIFQTVVCRERVWVKKTKTKTKPPKQWEIKIILDRTPEILQVCVDNPVVSECLEFAVLLQWILKELL